MTGMTGEMYTALDQFQSLVVEWNIRNFPPFASEDRLFKGIVEEVGEYAHATLKMQQGIRGSAEDHERKAQDALGDLFVYMCALAHKRGWTIADCIRIAWDDIKDRNWQQYPGNGKTS